MSGWTIALLIAAGVAAWLLFWIGLVMLIARFGGWRKLAESYPADRVLFEGPRSRMQSLVLKRWVSYSRCITFTVERDGILITVMPFFRPGHRPVFLPWSEMEVSDEKRMVAQVTVLRLRRAPSVPVTISRSLGERIRQAAGSSWPSPPQPLSPAERS